VSIASGNLAKVRLGVVVLSLHSKELGMFISSALCRTQEAAQRERAELATLENVRASAVRAADAWHKEGASAQAREQRDLARFNHAHVGSAIARNE